MLPSGVKLRTATVRKEETSREIHCRQVKREADLNLDHLFEKNHTSHRTI